MNEFTRYCPHCNEEHIVSPTYDTSGNPVGFFCNRVKLLVSAESDRAIWNGEDISDDIRGFTEQFIDVHVFKRLDSSRITSLGKRVAYAFLQTGQAKSRRLNFAFAQFYAEKYTRDLYESIKGNQPEGGRLEGVPTEQ